MTNPDPATVERVSGEARSRAAHHEAGIPSLQVLRE